MTPNVGHKFNILHLNVQCIRNKIEQIELCLHENNVDVICITEHWLNMFETESIKLHGYVLSAIFCRKQFKNGGVAIFVRENLSINVKEINFLKSFCKEKILEIVGIEIKLKTDTLNIIALYRSPIENNVEIFLKDLDCILSRTCLKTHAKTVLCGDLNIDYLSESTHKYDLVNIMSSYNIKNLISEATRITANSKKSIDYMCVNFNQCVSCSVIHSDLSDHSAQLLMLNKSQCSSPTYVTKRIFNLSNYQTFTSYISREQWLNVYMANNVNEAFELFSSTLMYYINISFPFTKVYVSNKNKSKPWVTQGIKNSSVQLKILHKKMLQTNAKVDILNFKRYKQIYRQVLKKAKVLYNDNFYRDSSNKSQAVWKIINNNIGNRSSRENSICELFIDDKTESDPLKLANLFNNFFINIPKQLNNNLPTKNNYMPSIITYPTFYLDTVSETEVCNIIMSMKKSNSVGFDGISSNLLIKYLQFFIKPLTYLINFSFAEGVFPSSLKIAKIIPLHKKGERDKIENYRPISLLSTISKVLEKIIFDKIVNFFLKFNILAKCQFGFQKGKSTKSAITNFLKSLYDNLNNKNRCVGIFLDLSKAFDLVNHELLLDKLYIYGLRGKIYMWIETFLSERSQIVEIQGYRSDKQNIDCGVPQGSVLGPLLFLIFVNDLPSVVDSMNLTLFADDTSYICSALSQNEVISKSQNILNTLSEWFTKNKLFVNTSKTEFMLFKLKTPAVNESYLLKINGSSIKQVVTVKFLGVHINQSLKWDDQVSSLCANLSSACYVLYRLQHVTSINTLLTYYYAHFYSRVTYSILFWGSSSLMLKVFRLQKRALRNIAGVNKYHSCRSLFKEMKLLTMPCIFIYEVLIFVKTNYSSFLTNNFHHDYDTRNSNALVTPQHNLSIFENNPFYVGIKFFNKLPVHIKSIENSKTFKNCLRNFLLDKSFYDVNEYINL